jgi:DNA-3-methyladenine glycosylase II
MADFSHSLALLKRDKRFAALIKKHGPPSLHRGGRTPFAALSRAIIHQQISGKAAASIYKKFLALFGIEVTLPVNWESRTAQKFPTPEDVLKMPVERLRSAGLSAQKVTYIKDLAQKFSDGTVPHKKLHRLSSAELVTILTQVKGIGVWTVQMFLIFTLNRLDVLPTGDLGIKKGFQAAYKLRALPSPAQMERLARPWRAHASVASWYLWRAVDTKN